jgi:hypothetical protein
MRKFQYCENLRFRINFMPDGHVRTLKDENVKPLISFLVAASFDPICEVNFVGWFWRENRQLGIFILVQKILKTCINAYVRKDL